MNKLIEKLNKFPSVIYILVFSLLCGIYFRDDAESAYRTMDALLPDLSGMGGSLFASYISVALTSMILFELLSMIYYVIFARTLRLPVLLPRTFKNILRYFIICTMIPACLVSILFELGDYYFYTYNKVILCFFIALGVVLFSLYIVKYYIPANLKQKSLISLISPVVILLVVVAVVGVI